MRDILKQADSVASSFRNVIIVGEFGSGRSWLAKRIHQNGNRRNKPFITVNCRVLEEHEALKRIFGYLALTKAGAHINRGALEQSYGGTVFFKNFNSFPEGVQQEVIKSINSSQIRRMGSKRTIEIDQPRIIYSVEIKPSHMLYEEEFLTDSMLSNNPYIIGQPSLRQRREDIAPLIKVFLDQEFRTHPEVVSRKVSPEVIYQCIKYHWPGNVRQLKNAIEHAAITSEHDIVQPADLPISIRASQPRNGELKHDEKYPSYKNAEKQLIKSVLETTCSSEEAAKLLGIDQDILSTKMKKFSLPKNGLVLEINHPDEKS